jgi:hypothetical protein
MLAVSKALTQFKEDGKVPDKISLSLASTTTKSRPRDGWTVLRRQADARGIKVSLTESEYLLLTSMPCTYCDGHLPPTGSGLDRLDHSLKEYSFDNCLPSCDFCNEFRRDFLSLEETAVAVNAIQRCRLEGHLGLSQQPSVYVAARPERYDAIRRKAFEEHSDLAQKRGMKLLTTWEEYCGKGFHHKKLRIDCGKDHVFERSMERHLSLKNCPNCIGRTNKGGAFIEKLSALGWTYKAGEYINKSSKVFAECTKCGFDRNVMYRTFTSEPKCLSCSRSPVTTSQP